MARCGLSLIPRAMDGLLQLDRVFRALGAALFCWLIAGLVYSGDLAEAATSKGRALHFLFDVLLVGLFGKLGATAMFVVLGVFAAATILLKHENS